MTSTQVHFKQQCVDDLLGKTAANVLGDFPHRLGHATEAALEYLRAENARQLNPPAMEGTSKTSSPS